MRKAIFRKITDGFITLRINGVPTKIGNGERFVADYEIVNGLPGVIFETFGETLTSNNGILQNGNVFTITDVPAMESFVPRDTEEPPDNPHADKDCRKCHGRGKYSFGGSYGGPVHWSSCECVMFKQPPPPKPTITIGFEPELLKSLKAKTPREWMLIKKHELKKIMDDAGIDYSQVSDDRMELYKFLFSILKDLN